MKSNKVIMKDNDIRILQKEINFNINLSYEDHINLIKIIKDDVKFLKKLKLMDYSLLLGIAKVDQI